MLFCYLIVLFLSISSFNCEDKDQLKCYQCKSTSKSPLKDCEDPFLIPNHKVEMQKNITLLKCSTKKNMKPKCFKAIGKAKNLENVFIRDCGYFMSGSQSESRCTDITLDNSLKIQAFNGCIHICKNDRCNFALSKTSNYNLIIIQVLFVLMILMFSSNTYSKYIR